MPLAFTQEDFLFSLFRESDLNRRNIYFVCLIEDVSERKENRQGNNVIKLKGILPQEL